MLLTLRVGTLPKSNVCFDTTYIEVESIEEAKGIWLSFLQQLDYQRDALGGDLYLNGCVIAIISPNGRVWLPAESGNDVYPKLSSGIEIVDLEEYLAMCKSGKIDLTSVSDLACRLLAS